MKSRNTKYETQSLKCKALAWAVLCFASLIQFGCANESVPQGGKQDTEPPKAVKMKPENKSINFKGNKIEITFDEFLKPGSFMQTLVSPPVDKKPDFKIAGKKLTIKLNSPLRENTTYTINFADDVQDLNEANVAPNFTYVFSTGNFIDSQKVSGGVFTAKDNQPAEGVVVSLYPIDHSDGFVKLKPFYFAKTDKGGRFEINNVKEGQYFIYGLKDQNYNYLYDQPNEQIAFSDSILSLTDSTAKTVDLYLFDEKKGELKLNEVRAVAPGFIQVSYTKPVESFKVNGELFSEDNLALYFDTKDTINYWYSNFYTEKTSLLLVANDTLIDTSRITLKFVPKDSLFSNPKYFLNIVNQADTNKIKANNGMVWKVEELYKPLKINFTRPVVHINETKRIQITDSLGNSVEHKLQLDEKMKQFILVDFERQENMVYSLEIPDSMFRDVLGTWNNNIVYKFRTNSKDNYGNLHITFKAEHPEKNYIIKLLNMNNEAVREFPFSGSTEKKVSVENILSGGYKIVVIDDTNKNGKWDTGNFETKTQPEKTFTFKENYQLKGGWDLDVEVKF